MIHAELTNKPGTTYTAQMIGGYYQMYYGEQNGVCEFVPRNLRLDGDTVRMTADDDVGKKILGLFGKNNTIDDVLTMLQTIREMRDDVRPTFEKRLVDGEYDSADDAYNAIKQMKIDLATDKISFYCPLVGNKSEQYDDEYYESFYEVDGDELLGHSDEITELLIREQPISFDMGGCLGRQANLYGRLTFVEWNVEEVGETLYGRVDCYLDGEIDDAELERLRDVVVGQVSDGFGESFEQRAIETSDGELYVSFWNGDDDYFMLTGDEFEEHLGQQNGMGGIQ